MKAIITLLPGHNPQQWQAESERLRPLADAEKERLESLRMAAVEEYGEERVAAMDRRPATASAMSYQYHLWSYGIALREATKYGKKRAYDEAVAYAAKSATEDRVQIVVVDSFSHKDELKSHGYRFDRDAHWSDPLGMHTKPGWVWRGAPGAAGEEIVWLQSQGCKITENDLLNTLVEQIRARGTR